MLQARLFSYSDTHRHRLGEIFIFIFASHYFIEDFFFLLISTTDFFYIIIFVKTILNSRTIIICWQKEVSFRKIFRCILLIFLFIIYFVGTNYQSIPVNCPFATTVQNYQVRDRKFSVTFNVLLIAATHIYYSDIQYNRIGNNFSSLLYFLDCLISHIHRRRCDVITVISASTQNLFSSNHTLLFPFPSLSPCLHYLCTPSLLFFA